jgi:hypothetical protein
VGDDAVSGEVVHQLVRAVGHVGSGRLSSRFAIAVASGNDPVMPELM